MQLKIETQSLFTLSHSFLNIVDHLLLNNFVTKAIRAATVRLDTGLASITIGLRRDPRPGYLIQLIRDSVSQRGRYHRS